MSDNVNTMKKIINKDMLEKYYWVAIYNDGTFLMQYEKRDNNTYIQNSFYDIDQSKLDLFVIKSFKDDSKIFQLQFKPDIMKLIWYWDRNLLLNDNTMTTSHCIGWQENHDNKQIKVILKIKEDGTVLLMRG